MSLKFTKDNQSYGCFPFLCQRIMRVIHRQSLNEYTATEIFKFLSIVISLQKARLKKFTNTSKGQIYRADSRSYSKILDSPFLDITCIHFPFSFCFSNLHVKNSHHQNNEYSMSKHDTENYFSLLYFSTNISISKLQNRFPPYLTPYL